MAPTHSCWSRRTSTVSKVGIAKRVAAERGETDAPCPRSRVSRASSLSLSLLDPWCGGGRVSGGAQVTLDPRALGLKLWMPVLMYTLGFFLLLYTSWRHTTARAVHDEPPRPQPHALGELGVVCIMVYLRFLGPYARAVATTRGVSLSLSLSLSTWTHSLFCCRSFRGSSSRATRANTTSTCRPSLGSPAPRPSVTRYNETLSLSLSLDYYSVPQRRFLVCAGVAGNILGYGAATILIDAHRLGATGGTRRLR